MDFKLCILAAGRGTRVSSYKGLHKALLPLGNRAVISHIMELFPNVPVVIAVGHRADQIKSYVSYTMPDRNVEYVMVDNFGEPGSGPGLSLLQCKDKLQCPFVFTSADTLVGNESPITPTHNWVGVCSAPDYEPYCRFNGKLGYDVKGPAFIGMAGVYDYEQFWDGLSQPNIVKGEHQVIDGLNAIKLHSKVYESWVDTGNDHAYSRARRQFNESVEPKSDEAIFIDGGKVVKFFSDAEKVADRVTRASVLRGLVPNVTRIDENFYGYEYVKGKCLSDVTDEGVIDAFFSYLGKTFQPLGFGAWAGAFYEDCMSIHMDKFIERACRMGRLESVKTINGVPVPSIEDLIHQIDFAAVVGKSTPITFHGDLQPENIICDGNKFTLIDWRDRFGRSTTTGDLYYDLGKLWHAIVVNGHIIRSDLYDAQINGPDATVTIHYRSNLMSTMAKFKKFCRDYGYDWSHVVLLGVMQFIGISPLHEEPYSDFLYLYGKLALTKKLSNQYELE